MITFIHPYAFIWLTLAIPLVLFYLWRARRPQAQVVTGALWRKAIPLLHPRRAWQKQRWIVSLLVQLSILIVIVTALAEPCWRRPQRVVLILDATESMSVALPSGEASETRYAKAQEKARELVQNMGYVDSLALLVVGEQIWIHSRMSHDREQILASIDNVPKSGGSAPIHEAVSMAKSLIKAGTGGAWDAKNNHVILVSDGCFPLADQVLKDDTVRWIPIGESVGNVQIETLIADRRNALKPESAEIFASLRNFGSKTVDGTLTIAYADKKEEFSVAVPSLEDGGLHTQTVPIQYADATEVKAEFKPKNAQDDALAGDNTAETVLQEGFSYHVTIVTPQKPNTLLENAIQTLPSVELNTVIVKEGYTLTDTEAKKIATFAESEPFRVLNNGVKQFRIVIFDRVVPDESFGENTFDRAIFFAPPESTLLWERNDVVCDYVIMPWIDGLRYGISTAGVGFTGTHALVPRENVTAQPWLFSQSALELNENQNVAEEDKNFAKQAKTVEMTELAWGLVSTPPDSGKNDMRSVLVACDLTQSDWILADDFPQFLRYSFDWLIHTEASNARLEYGDEMYWQPAETFADSDLNLPALPEKIFVFPGEDIIPMWTILVLILCGVWATEWYFYQRRWLE